MVNAHLKGGSNTTNFISEGQKIGKKFESFHRSSKKVFGENIPKFASYTCYIPFSMHGTRSSRFNLFF